MSTADVMLHVDESLDQSGRDRVQQTLRDMDGVTGVRTDAHTPHLFVVHYNPSSVNSGDILHRVTAGGLHAELVGM